MSGGRRDGIPHALRRLLLDALAVRDRYSDLLARQTAEADVIEGTCVELAGEQPLLSAGEHGEAIDTTATDEGRERRPEMIITRPDRQAELGSELERLERRLDQLIARNPTHPPNKKLLAHLTNERAHLLTFLKVPGVAATNWRAEQAIRPAVVNRKNWGGNRTDHGAEVQQTLISVIRTGRQQHVCPIALLTDLQRHTNPGPSSMLQLPTAASADPRGP